jgi:hypothetical protein
MAKETVRKGAEWFFILFGAAGVVFLLQQLFSGEFARAIDAGEWSLLAAWGVAGAIVVGCFLLASVIHDPSGLRDLFHRKVAMHVSSYHDDEWVNSSVYVDGEALGLTGKRLYVTPGSHSVGVSPKQDNFTFQYFEGYPENQNPITVFINSDLKLTARYLNT